MYTDIPKFKRCCFCLPLRYSLLVWACISLGLSISELGIIASTLADVTIHDTMGDELIDTFHKMMTVFCINGIIVSSLQILASFILMIAAIKKHGKLFRVIYYFYIVNVATTIVLNIIQSCFSIYMDTITETPKKMTMMHIIKNVTVIFGVLLFQGYIILLIRSEMTKLRGETKIQFINNAAEGQVVLEKLEEI